MTMPDSTDIVVEMAPDAGATTDGNILVADKVTMRFGGLLANRDVDFRVPRGSIVSLIGPNGAGKTTFFNQLTGMLEPTSGEISFEGTSIVGLEPHDIAELGIGRTFQNIRLFSAMSSLDNVMVGRHTRMKARWWASLLRLPQTRAEELSVEAPGARAPRRWWACGAATTTMPPATCRTATSGASSWLEPSRVTPSSCSSTSRPPA